MRYELTDGEWAAIRPMLPNKARGVPRVDDRRVLNGICWVLRSGAPWRDLPDCYGSRFCERPVVQFPPAYLPAHRNNSSRVTVEATEIKNGSWVGFV
jgi:transposase